MQSSIAIIFGFGLHQFIGKKFASIEYKIVLINFIKRYSNLKKLHPRRFKVDTVAYFEIHRLNYKKND